jgi:hypothetical protein
MQQHPHVLHLTLSCLLTPGRNQQAARKQALQQYSVKVGATLTTLR